MPHSLIPDNPLLLSPTIAMRCGVDEALLLGRLWQWAPTGQLSLSATALAAALPGMAPGWVDQQLDSLHRQAQISVDDLNAQPLELQLAPWPSDAETAPPIAVSLTLITTLGTAEASLLSGLDLLAQTLMQQPIETTWEALAERFPWWTVQQLRQLSERLQELGVLWFDAEPPPALTVRLSLEAPKPAAPHTPASDAEPLQELAIELERQKGIPVDFSLTHSADLPPTLATVPAGERVNLLRQHINGRWQRHLAAADSHAAVAATTSAADTIDRVFHLFARLFPQQFRKAWPSPDALDEVKQLWRMALKKVPPAALLAAAQAAVRHSPYLPALAEVARRCAAPSTDTPPTEPPPTAWSESERNENLVRLRELRRSLGAGTRVPPRR